MSAKEKILQAYESILINEGEKAATMDSVARAAGVSKGGLLYHFPSKEAMAAGVVERFTALAQQDLELMKNSAEGASTYYINVSFYEDSDFDRSIVAVSRLAQESNRAASAALKESQDAVTRLIEQEVGDSATARAIVLLADGMYYNAAFMGTEGQAENDREILLAAVKKLRG